LFVIELLCNFSGAETLINIVTAAEKLYFLIVLLKVYTYQTTKSLSSN